MKNILLFLLLLPLGLGLHAQIITTVAGTDSVLYNGDSILATDATLDGPIGVAFDGKGNFYIADTYHNRIRKVDTAGIITTIAGIGGGGYNGDGIPATAAEIYSPAGIICDHSGNIYFADAYNNRIRKIDTAGIITTVAGNGDTTYNGDNILADSATVYDPHWVALDNSGNLYITDWGHHRIRKVNTADIITTIAGTGTAGYTGDNTLAVAAEIDAPYGIALDDTGSIYFADAFENVVRKIDTFGIITAFAGTGIQGFSGDNGPANSAKLNGPVGLAIDGSGNMYISDADNSKIRKVSAEANIITTIAGSGFGGGFSGDNGPATAAKLNFPAGIAFAPDSSLYFADFNNDRIRRIGWPLSVNQLSTSAQSVAVYPNPSQGLFTIIINSNSLQRTQLTITNTLGERVEKTTLNTNTPFTIQLNQPSGMYVLSTITSDRIINKIINVIK